jgi:hypothetical protein
MKFSEGFSEVWQIIFSFLPPRKSLNLMSVCRHFEEVLTDMDEVRLCRMLALMKSKTNHVYELPSLEFFRTPKARVQLKGAVVDVSAMISIYGVESGQKYLEILKCCLWIVPPEVPIKCIEVERVISDLNQLSNILNELLFEGHCENPEAVWSLLEKYEEYFPNQIQLITSDDTSTIPEQCYLLITDEKLDYQPEILYQVAAQHFMIREEDPHILNYVPESLRTDRTFIMKCIRSNGYAYLHLDDTMTRNKEIILAAMKSRDIFDYIDEDLIDRDIAIAAVEHNLSHFYDLDESLQKDRDVIRAALHWKPHEEEYFLKYIDLALYSDDEQMMFDIVSVYPECMKNASERLLNDREFLLKIVGVRSYALKYLLPFARNDKEIVMKAVGNPSVVKYASEELKNDRDVVMKCMMNSFQTHLAFEYLPEYWRDDYEIILTAVTHCGIAIEHASERLRMNRHIVESAIDHGQLGVFEFLSDEFTGCKEFMMKAISKSPVCASFASELLKDDLEYVRMAISTINDEYIVEAAFSEFVSDRIQKMVADIQDEYPDKSVVAAIEDIWMHFKATV